MRGQPGEDLVELAIRDASRDPVGHPGPIPPTELVAIQLHRIVMRVCPPASTRPVQRERVDDRPGARIPVKVIERAQHRLAMRTHRRRECLTTSLFQAAGRTWRTPVRARSLASDLHPPGEVTGLNPSRPIPRDTDVGPQEPKPPQQVQPIRADGGLRSTRRQQVPEVGGDSLHQRPVGINQAVGLVPIARSHQPTRQRNQQRHQIPPRITVFDHEREPYRSAPPSRH